MKRPWRGETSDSSRRVDVPDYDPSCPLCPGNTRASGATTPHFAPGETCVFDNDFPALLPPPPEDFADACGSAGTSEAAAAAAAAAADAAAAAGDGSGRKGGRASSLFRREAVSGMCRVVCSSPRHGAKPSTLTHEEWCAVVRTWTKESVSIPAARADIAAVQIFENRGAMMGCSMPHPHSQIWATSHVPDTLAAEIRGFASYARQRRPSKTIRDGRERAGPADGAAHDLCCLLCDLAAEEIGHSPVDGGDGGGGSNGRVVCVNDAWVAVVPFWATWPFELLVLPRRHVPDLQSLTEHEASSFAEILRRIAIRYDNLFKCDFPYSFGIHGAPARTPDDLLTGDDDGEPLFHLHAHFYPPLLRSATVRKFMVGFELMAEAQRDLTPEAAAVKLRAVSDQQIE